MDTDRILVLVTCATAEEAGTIAERLVEERLAACATVAGPVQSVFRWQGAISRETEHQLILKTRRACFDALAQRVRELHSYEVPEIVALPIAVGSADYLNWIDENTESDNGA
jgi:periplasmic divalent cation tolerance protein